MTRAHRICSAIAARAALNAHAAQRDVYAWPRAYAQVAESWLPLLRRVARLLLRKDPRLRHDAHAHADLVQEALIRSWELDPSRFAEADHRYVKRDLLRRMRSAAKRERRRSGRKRRVTWEQAALEKPWIQPELEVPTWDT